MEKKETKQKQTQKAKKPKVDLTKKIKDLEKHNLELADQILRISADYENYKKRLEKEKIEVRKYASMDLISELLISLDQLKKVCEMEVDNELLNNYLIGFKMINNQLFQTLSDDGLKEINILNKPFDPNVAHAVEKVSIKEKENNIVVEEIQKGYKYKEKLLRPAMVKVNEWSD